MIFESDDGSTVVRSYSEMRARAVVAASDLLDSGIQFGARVHIHLPNCSQFLDWRFGAAAIGA